MTAIGPVLKYPGSKWRMAKWIIRHFPRHDVYLEPFFGSGAVFFSKPPSRLETINDIDGRVVNLFRVIRDQPEDLVRALELTPYARDEYVGSDDTDAAPVEDARRFLVRCWQAHGSVTGHRVGWRSDIQGKVGKTPAHQWRDLPPAISDVANRLRGVQVENQPAVGLLERYRFPNVLVYADPPYVSATRAAKLYAHEMTDADHSQLLDALSSHPGPVVLSGYRNDLYDAALDGWTVKVREMRIEKGQKRIEVVWLNPCAAGSLQQSVLPLEATA